MNISIIGTGYVGLVSGVCMAEVGHSVTCVDNVKQKVDAINQGIAPIHEAGLDDLLQKVIGDRLNATEDLEKAVLNSDITFIAVGTPFDGTKIDLRYIEAVARQIGRALKGKAGYHVVVVKSTVIPGTTDELVRDCLEQESGISVGEKLGLGMNPEFLTEGRAIEDFMHPDRIVIGGNDDKCRQVLKNVYAPFSQVETIFTNNKTAEMIKYTSNAVLATMISFANEIAGLCSAVGDIDVVDVMKGVHASTYFTTRRDDAPPVTAAITSFLGAGCGFGGSCLPKDVKALAAQGATYELPMNMLNSVIAVNRDQPARMLGLVRDHYDSIQGLKIAILGLAFKPDTDDVRESPAFPVARLLHREGARLVAYDPVATDNAKSVLQDVPMEYATGMSEAVADADVIMVVTAWDEFRQLPELLQKTNSDALVVDGRRLLGRDSVEHYTGIGL